MKAKFIRIAAMAVLMLAAMTMGQAQNVPITLNQGWNWISYPHSEPMSISEALSGFTPAQGDVIKSQTDGNCVYQNGTWRGTLTTLVPGKGYMYKSADGTVKSFVFGGVANDPSALPEEALSGEFTVAVNGTKVRFSPGNLQCRINPTQETQAVVGTGTSTTAYMPYYTYYCYSLCQMIYKAEELHEAGLTAGPITGIAFQSESNLHHLRDNIEIWMSSTTLSTAPTTSVSTSGMKKVFYGSVTQQTGWTEIAFTTPWLWDGTSNVLVTVLMNHGSYNSPYIYWRCSSPGFTSSCYTYTDSSPYNPTTTTYSMSTSSSRPNTRFNGKGGATWRFAEKQWDYIGAGNANVSGAYTGWIDLFGWGTSGHPHGANCFQPWSTSTANSDYDAYGDASYNLYDQTGEADWGCNAISNGGGKPNQWRTLTADEWGYVFYTRSTASGIRFAAANVNGVNGVILLPDNWSNNYYTLNMPNVFLPTNVVYSANTITTSQWNTLEQHGAVFLPAAGYRNGTSVSNVDYQGNYWSASSYDSDKAKCLYFYWTPLYYYQATLGVSNLNRCQGQSVRLVCQSNPRIRTLGVSSVSTTGATVSAEVDFTGSVGARGICWNTTGAPTYDDNHASSGSGKGSFSKALTGLQPNTTYYVRAYAKISSVYRYGNTLTFTTADDGSNGHAYVDLGLPSGLLWATCNVGASAPEDYGDYFAWGETQPKDIYNWTTYQYCNGSYTTLTKYCTNADYGYNGYVDNLTTLLPEDDAATANWGDGWRMPTREEWQELYNNTTQTWTTQNGVNGRLFTATNGNSLFLPAAGGRWGGELDYAGSNGSYWSSSLSTGSPDSAWGLYFNSGYTSVYYYNRYSGFSVRPVREN